MSLQSSALFLLFVPPVLHLLLQEMDIVFTITNQLTGTQSVQSTQLHTLWSSAMVGSTL